MYYYLNGTVAAIESGVAVIDCSGVGYLCQCSMNTLSHLEVGKQAKLYTHVNVKEDAIDIIGFHDQQEKRLFLLLTGVSGVGPKAALSILSVAAPEQLALAVVEENESVITAAQGVGKKLAQRVILELKDKLAKEGLAVSGGVSAPGPVNLPGNRMNDVQAALSVLGYTANEINAALRQVDVSQMSVEEAVRYVLQHS